MLDILKLIVDVMSKVLPALSGQRKEHRLGEIGADMFSLYVHTNEAVLNGEVLVGLMEEYIARVDRNDKYKKFLLTAIAAHLVQQGANLARIFDSIDDLADKLHIAGGESFAALVGLLRGKTSAIWTLLTAMVTGRLLGAAIEDDLRALITGTAADNYGRGRFPGDHAMMLDAALADTIQEGARPVDFVVDDDDDGNSEAYRLIAHYLEYRKPRKQLRMIKDELREFRTNLEQTFTIRDVLLNVDERGLRRPSSRWQGRYWDELTGPYWRISRDRPRTR
jgi:hypothetical protein